MPKTARSLAAKNFIYGSLSAIFVITVFLRAVDTGSQLQWLAVFLAFCLVIRFWGKMLKILIKKTKA